MNPTTEVSALFAAMDSAVTELLVAQELYSRSKTRANKAAVKAAGDVVNAATIAYDMARNPPGSFLCFHCNKPAITPEGTCGSPDCK